MPALLGGYSSLVCEGCIVLGALSGKMTRGESSAGHVWFNISDSWAVGPSGAALKGWRPVRAAGSGGVSVYRRVVVLSKTTAVPVPVRDELKDLVPDAELSLPGFNVVTGSYDPRSLKSTLPEYKTMRYGIKCTPVPRATAVDRFERSLLGDIQRGLAARDAAWHNTEPGQKGPLRDIMDMSEYTGMFFGTMGRAPWLAPQGTPQLGRHPGWWLERRRYGRGTPGLDEDLLAASLPEVKIVPDPTTTTLTAMATPDATARTDTLPPRPFL
eukprot:jgi/Tetstr1/424125/TSEL_014734.t1